MTQESYGGRSVCDCGQCCNIYTEGKFNLSSRLNIIFLTSECLTLQPNQHVLT